MKTHRIVLPRDQHAAALAGWKGGLMPEHEMQHPDAPTWCIHCGTFSTHVETTKCTEDRGGKWDARKNALAMIQSILGKLVPEVPR